MAPLEAYLAEHPRSPYRASLLLNLGLAWRQAGRYSRAMTALEEAWRLLEPCRTPSLSRLADRAAAELAELQGQFGRQDALAHLLSQVEGRPLVGSAFERLAKARRGLGLMASEPALAFRCGPLGLDRIRAARGLPPHPDWAARTPSTPRGTSLAQNAIWARELGLPLRAAHRHPGATLPLPALIHGRLGHFAAVIEHRDGRYRLQDPTFGEEIWIPDRTLEEEGSGYALIPKGPLPRGWRPVSRTEAGRVWGRGTTSTGPENGPYPDDERKPERCPAPPGMPVYRMGTAYVNLEVTDSPVGYAPPRGPAVRFRITYDSRNAHQPQAFTFANLGPRWSAGWVEYLVDDPAFPGQTVYLHAGTGGRIPYAGYDPATAAYAPQARTRDRLRRTGQAAYRLEHPDGSVALFEHVDGASTFPRRVFLTRRLDPAGNPLDFRYDDRNRLTEVVDALGRSTLLVYGNPSDPLKITGVQDPFGRRARLEYDDAGLLVQVTDAMGMATTFTYGPTPQASGAPRDFLNAMATPYGTTTFAMGEGGGGTRWIEAADPLGHRERVEFRHAAPGIAAAEAAAPQGFTNAHLDLRNTFYWSKRAYAAGPGDYRQAEITHFLHASNPAILSSIPESTRKPLESRVWMAYGGTGDTIREGRSPRPTVRTRMLDRGGEQRTTWAYNAWGKVTEASDALGRTLRYRYSEDGSDLLEVRNVTGGRSERLAAFTYDHRHLPLTATDAAGQTTTFTYDAWGRLTSRRDPLGRTNTVIHDDQGFRREILGPGGERLEATTWDEAGRVRTHEDANGLKRAFDYDALDRLVRVTFPDGTTEETAYHLLEPERTKDRLDRWTRMTHDALGRLEEIQDPLGRRTRFAWCACGELESLTDPLGRSTTWNRDLQGRVCARILPDGSSFRYQYDGVGRLAKRTDAKGQVTTYRYAADDALIQVDHPGAEASTPPATFAFDPAYPRIVSSTGAQGLTTYAYHPVTERPTLGAGRLASVLTPAGGLAYAYDELGRLARREVDGRVETRVYDDLGRLARTTNDLGAFRFAYHGAGNQIRRIDAPNGQSTTFSLLPEGQDLRLGEVRNQRSDGSLLSVHAYTYDPGGRIRSWTHVRDARPPLVQTFTHDAAGQLLSATLTDKDAGQVLRTLA
ncbi:MAG TPA: hypothetical protein VK188_15805, partial [Holophaga sp.]|nr:hypothetical protein [Holophaga sp.]